MTSMYEGRGLADILKMVLYQRRVLVIGAAFFAILAFGASHFLQLTYEASAAFEHRSDFMLGGIGDATTADIKASVQNDLAGLEAVQSALVEVGYADKLAKNPDGTLTDQSRASLESAARMYSQLVRFRWKVRSKTVDVVEVVYCGSNADFSQKFVNALVQNYVHNASTSRVEQLKRTREFVAGKVSEYERVCNELVQKQLAFQSQYGGTMVDNPDGLRQQIDALQASLDHLRRQQAISKQRVEDCLRAARNVKARSLQVKLDEMVENREAAMVRGHMTERHPSILAMDRQIEKLRATIARVETTPIEDPLDDPDPAVRDVAMRMMSAQTEYDSLVSEGARIQHRLSVYQTVAANAGSILIKQQQILKPLEKANDSLKTWQNQLGKIDVAIEAEESSLQNQLLTVRLASTPREPQSPKPWSVIAFGLIGGLAFGYVAAFFAASSTTTVRSVEEFSRHIDVPICGVIDEIESSSQRTIRNIRRRLSGFILAVLLIGGVIVSAASIHLKLTNPDQYQRWLSRFHAASAVSSNPSGAGTSSSDVSSVTHSSVSSDTYAGAIHGEDH
jgi:uncharacterized protein involved in exopolysaccharide biosynthesis